MSVIANSLTNQSTGQPIYSNFISNPMEADLDGGGYEIKNVYTDETNNTDVANVSFVKNYVANNIPVIPEPPTPTPPSTIKGGYPTHIFSTQENIAIGTITPTAQLLALLPSPILSNPENNYNNDDKIIEPQIIHMNGYISINQELTIADGITVQFYLVMVRSSIGGQNDVFDVFRSNPSHTVANIQTTWWGGQHRIPFSCSLFWDTVYPAFDPVNNASMRAGLQVYFWKKEGAIRTIQVNPDPLPSRASIIATTFSNANPIPNNPGLLSLSQLTPNNLPAIPNNHTRIKQFHPGASPIQAGVQALQNLMNNGYYDYNRTQATYDIDSKFTLSMPPFPTIIPPSLNRPSVIRIYEQFEDSPQRLVLYLTASVENPHVYINTGATTSSPDIYDDISISVEIEQSSGTRF